MGSDYAFGKHLRTFQNCPLCGITDPSLIYRHKVQYYKRHEDDQVWYAWFIYQCESCGGPISCEVVGGRSAISDGNPNFSAVNPTLNFVPSPQEFSEYIPERARNYLKQTKLSLAAPDGAAMLANSAVDAMLKARGLIDGSVYSRLSDAVQQGILTEEMREWGDIVRIESNNPRHADLGDPHVTTERAKLMLEFASALANVLFVLPALASAARSDPEA